MANYVIIEINFYGVARMMDYETASYEDAFRVADDLDAIDPDCAHLIYTMDQWLFECECSA